MRVIKTYKCAPRAVHNRRGGLAATTMRRKALRFSGLQEFSYAVHVHPLFNSKNNKHYHKYKGITNGEAGDA